MPDLAQQFEIKIVGTLGFYVLFVVLVTFGVVNAFIMTVHERTQEFGVLLALGMRPGGDRRDAPNRGVVHVGPWPAGGHQSSRGGGFVLCRSTSRLSGRSVRCMNI